MIIDLQTTFSGSTAADGTVTGQSLTATAISSNVLDLRAPGTTPTTVDESLQGDHALWFVASVTVAVLRAGGASSLTLTLESDANVGLDSGSATVHYSSAAIPKATLVAGYVIVRTKLPIGDYQRYLGVRYTFDNAPDSGRVRAYLTPTLDRNITYPKNFTLDA